MIGPCRYAPELKEILARAGLAYRQHDDFHFHELMEKASALAPERQDIPFALANHHIQTGNPELALAIYKRLSRVLPDDSDILFHLAHWSRFANDAAEAGAAERRLAELNPEKAGALARIQQTVETWIAKPLSAALPERISPDFRTAIVIFGYRLEADGSRHPFLLSRLKKTLETAECFPEAPIVATGGVPAAGRVEAVEMRRWLVEHGIPEARVLEEGYARDLSENVIFSRRILVQLGAKDILCVVSAIAARRAGACMETIGWNAGSPWRRVETVISGESADFSNDGQDRLKLFRDVLRVYGIPMMQIYPELAER
ncbi:MAG: YdcF family protein [Planctomycetota bacterium]|jgi:uncharacterized SAM-binding protein YcdF (DUF218 family)|nr:YdcF family protein [Planctomycetota bacterium]